MGMDRILLLGLGELSAGLDQQALHNNPDSDKTASFLIKLGYEVLKLSDQSGIPEFLVNNELDAVLLDSSFTPDLLEFIEFLRSFESTKNIPIIALIDRPRQLHELKEKKISRLELLQKPVSIGILASRIATSLRVRKLEGSDINPHASVGDINANLKDINRRMSLEREEAKRIQLALLPVKAPESEYFDLAVSYRPLEDIGGDWFYFDIDQAGILNFQIADITGHGIAAAFIGSMTKLALTAAGTTKPAELLSRMNKLMVPVLPEGRFVTMATLEFCPSGKKLSASYAGHPPAILWRADRKVAEEIKCSGFPLGFKEDASYSERNEILASGDVLVVYTDGLSEARNRQNLMFGTAQICAVLEKISPNQSSSDIMEKLFLAFESFRESRLLRDDVTVMILRIK